MPKPARAAIVVAFLIAIMCGLNLRSGPLMLLGICFAALLSAIGMLQRKAWSAYGVVLLLVFSILAVVYIAITGHSTGSSIQIVISIILYLGLACLFLLAGHMLSLTGAKRGTPIPWILLALLFSVPFLFYRQVTMPSNAMQQAVLVGDSLLFEQHATTQPALGDVVAFYFPLDRNQILIRRIAGLPGDKIRFVSGELFRNNSAIPEPYATQTSKETIAEMQIPAGKCYVLGDSRTESLDSRHWGLINLSDIIGKPRLIFDSLAPDTADIKPADGKSGEKTFVQPGPLLHRWDRVLEPFHDSFERSR